MKIEDQTRACYNVLKQNNMINWIRRGLDLIGIPDPMINQEFLISLQKFKNITKSIIWNFASFSARVKCQSPCTRQWQ